MADIDHPANCETCGEKSVAAGGGCDVVARCVGGAADGALLCGVGGELKVVGGVGCLC